MEQEVLFAYLLKTLFVVTSPVTFIVGIFLLYDVNTFLKIEKFLARSYGSQKTFMHNLEKNRESLQMFLLKRRKAVGIICLLNSLLTIFIVMFLLAK
jgi:hypothetical protein